VSILAISNANAKKVAKRGSSLTKALLPDGSLHHHTTSPEDLHPIFKQTQAQITHVVIEGGDGTVRTVLSALLNSYDETQELPAISILPRGTTNQIGRNLGIKKAPELTAIFKGKYRPIMTPMVKIKSKAFNAPQYGFLFSTGALPHVSRFTQDKINAKGVGGGTAVVGAVLKAVTSDKAGLMPSVKHRLKGKSENHLILDHKGAALGTIMTTLPTLMMGLDPFWGTEDAPLRLTWAEPVSGRDENTIVAWMAITVTMSISLRYAPKPPPHWMATSWISQDKNLKFQPLGPSNSGSLNE